MSDVVSTKSLTKRYGRTRALDGLDLSVSEGEVHGFLGPNGAGKSTTLRILVGLARATSGTVTVLGRDPWRDAAGIGRVRWLADHLVVAGVSILLVVTSATVGAAVGIAVRQSEWSLLGDVVVTGAGQAVAAAVFAGVTGLVFATLPRLTIPIAWSLVLVAMIVGLFGPVFGFPEWVVRLSPVGVAPTVAADTVDVRGLWWLVGGGAAGVVVALALMRRRELAPA